ncbi:MAG: AEC family transporter [Desulfomicrobiaceae bacterium]
MLEIFSTIAPVFVLMLLGAVIFRLDILPPAAGSILNTFVYRLALPLLLFSSIAQASLARIFQAGFVGGVVLGTLIPFVGTAALVRRWYTNPQSWFVAFAATFSNAAFVGLPVLQLLFPQNPDAVLAMGIFALFGLPFVLAAVFVLERQHSPQTAGRALLGVLARNPLLLGSLAGLAVAVVGIRLPQWITVPCQMLGHTASPLALIAIGMTLARTARATIRDLGPNHLLIGAVKLFVQPAVTFVVLSLWQVDPTWRAMGTMLAAMPVGTMAFVLAEAYGTLAPMASAAVFGTTVLATITLPLVFSLLRAMG